MFAFEETFLADTGCGGSSINKSTSKGNCFLEDIEYQFKFTRATHMQ